VSGHVIDLEGPVIITPTANLRAAPDDKDGMFRANCRCGWGGTFLPETLAWISGAAHVAAMAQIEETAERPVLHAAENAAIATEVVTSDGRTMTWAAWLEENVTRRRAAEAALERVRALHIDSGVKVQHWCSVWGGGMEPAHEPDAPNQCAECGEETPWPCPTYTAAALPQDGAS
jgi:hypothetical protein